MQIKNIAVLISGSGSNLQAVIDASLKNEINGKVSVVISHKKDAYGLERAKKHNIDAIYLNPKEYKNNEEYHGAIIEKLKEHNIDFVVLAGYLKILTKDFVKKYEGRIINIHPSLIPKYCGKGFYGIKVHEAVINGNEKETGATVHFVDEGTDTGKIIIQEKLSIDIGETKEHLQKRVLDIEHSILIKALKKVL
jgi:phosphoribosylglycinamide formyltransferase-1